MAPSTELTNRLRSKTLAEKAAWEYVEKNASSISFDLVTINPPFVSEVYSRLSYFLP